MKIRRHGPISYFIDGFKVQPSYEKNDSLKILRQAAKLLEGFWISKEEGYTARLIISKKTLKGQMLMPYEKIQQAPPLSIRLAYNETRILSLITSHDTLRFSVSDDELRLEDKNFTRAKKKPG